MIDAAAASAVLPARRAVCTSFKQIRGVSLILLQVAPLHQRAVARDDDIDVLDRGNGFRQRLRVRDAAAAVGAIDARRVFPREQVARLQHAQGREVRPSRRRWCARRRSNRGRCARCRCRSDRLSLNVFFGRKTALSPLKASIFVMFAFVFSCAMISTLVPNMSSLPVWSPCVCVLMMVVTGLLVIDFTLFEERLAPAGELRIHEHDAAVGDEHADVAAAERGIVARRGAGEDVVVVGDLLDVDHLPGLLRRGHRERPRRGAR